MIKYEMDGPEVHAQEVRDLEHRVKLLEDTLRMLGVGICQNLGIEDTVKKNDVYPVRKLGDTRVVKVLCPDCKTYHTCIITEAK